MAVQMIENVRYHAEAELLKQAVGGDSHAINKVLLYLSSTNPDLRQMMQATLHDVIEPWSWRYLLRCLAVHRWLNDLDCDRRSDPLASSRIDQAITEAFDIDESPVETTLKNEALNVGLIDPDHRVRQAAAVLLARRGQTRSIPALVEIIRTGELEWQLKAIVALGHLKDEACGWPLVEALAMDHGPLHQAAKNSLHRIGKFAEPALLEALNHTDSHIRWHAARALCEIGQAKAAPLLAEGLCDDNPSVRWASATALAHLGEMAVPAILSTLSHHPLHEPLRETAYHALHAMPHSLQPRLEPVLAALTSSAAHVEAPIAAQKLLNEWR